MHVPFWSVLPFAVLVIALAVLPLIEGVRHHWVKPHVQLAGALALGLPMAAWMILRGDRAAIAHAVVEYGQFITLLAALYVVTGGIHLAGDLQATPRTNVLLLAAGTLAASLVGTTGAAMLLVRPLLATNRQRRHTVHTAVFTIFLAANTGGLLTPIGDPPLFLGLLRGVPFLWTLRLAGPWVLVNGLLLLAYWALDRRAFAREDAEDRRRDVQAVQPLRVRGAGSLAGLGLIVLAVALVPSVDLHALGAGHARWWSYLPLREAVLLAVAGASLRWGDRAARYEGNRFHWGPIAEVAAVFAGIFLTMAPALRYLAQVAPRLHLTPVRLFLYTGSLSSVLDNAPTYATFFEMARRLPDGGAARVAGVPEPALVALSLGAVLCGAMTYIGNGPNFMLRAVAESEGVRMPGFGGYVGRWALRYLVPVLAAMVLVFLVEGWPWRLAGAALALALAARSIWLGLRAVPPAPLPATGEVPEPEADHGREGARPAGPTTGIG